MAQYKVLELSYINNRIVHPGEVVEFDGEASSNLRLIESARALESEDTPERGNRKKIRGE